MITLPSVKQVGLIVHDMSNDALKPGGKYPNAANAPSDPAVQQFIANNVRLLDAARRRQVAVFHTGHYLRPDYLDVAPGGNSARFGALQADSRAPQSRATTVLTATVPVSKRRLLRKPLWAFILD